MNIDQEIRDLEVRSIIQTKVMMDELERAAAMDIKKRTGVLKVLRGIIRDFWKDHREPDEAGAAVRQYEANFTVRGARGPKVVTGPAIDTTAADPWNNEPAGPAA